MPEKRDRIKRFVNDVETAKAVHGVLLRAFLKPQKDRDVYTLAASRIAIDLLDDAWKELARYKNEEEMEKTIVTQQAL